MDFTIGAISMIVALKEHDSSIATQQLAKSAEGFMIKVAQQAAEVAEAANGVIHHLAEIRKNGTTQLAPAQQRLSPPLERIKSTSGKIVALFRQMESSINLRYENIRRDLSRLDVENRENLILTKQKLEAIYFVLQEARCTPTHAFWTRPFLNI